MTKIQRQIQRQTDTKKQDEPINAQNVRKAHSSTSDVGFRGQHEQTSTPRAQKGRLQVQGNFLHMERTGRQQHVRLVPSEQRTTKTGPPKLQISPSIPVGIRNRRRWKKSPSRGSVLHNKNTLRTIPVIPTKKYSKRLTYTHGTSNIIEQSNRIHQKRLRQIRKRRQSSSTPGVFSIGNGKARHH